MRKAGRGSFGRGEGCGEVAVSGASTHEEAPSGLHATPALRLVVAGAFRCLFGHSGIARRREARGRSRGGRGDERPVATRSTREVRAGWWW